MSFTVQKPYIDEEICGAIFPFSLRKHSFAETLIFPKAMDTAILQSKIFQKLLNLTACVLGTSYFKLLAPIEIQIPHFALTGLEQELIVDLYENGMGEFYARNNLRRFGKLKFQVDTAPTSKPVTVHENSTPRPLLLIGGGKDSNVSAHLLANQNINFTPLAVNPKGPIVTSIKAIGNEPLFVKRILDPDMIAMSSQPGFYNGHVPSTAINSMIAALSATLYGYDTIILSNERSASEATVLYDGRPVNHQHSKSLIFEKLLRKTLAQTSEGGLDYFSLLRPLSELKIGKIFAETKIFDTCFSSCNSNFKQGDNSKILWCNSCPKCHFVYLMFAPFMSLDRLNRIFGNNPLSNPKNQASLRALIGLSAQKPWECVGETMEAATALFHLNNDPNFPTQDLTQRLAGELLAKHGEKKLIAAWDDLFINSSDHCLPYHFLRCMPDHNLR